MAKCLSPIVYRDLCVSHNFFTCGSNEQYEVAMQMARQGRSTHDIAVITWICSSDFAREKYSIHAIEELLKTYAR